MSFHCKTALWVLVLSGGAAASEFSFPPTLPGFTARPVGASFAADGGIQVLLKRAETQCDQVGIYEYHDGPAATQGLTSWLAQLKLTAKEYDRTDAAVLWAARTEQMELIGEWRAAGNGRPGTLEMCQHSLVPEVTTSIPVKLIALLLAGVGALGAATGQFYTRMTARRSQSAG